MPLRYLCYNIQRSLYWPSDSSPRSNLVVLPVYFSHKLLGAHIVKVTGYRSTIPSAVSTHTKPRAGYLLRPHSLKICNGSQLFSQAPRPRSLRSHVSSGILYPQERDDRRCSQVEKRPSHRLPGSSLPTVHWGQQKGHLQSLIFTEIQFKEVTRPGDDQHAPINQVSLRWTAGWGASVAWSLWPIRAWNRCLRTHASIESEWSSKQSRPLRHFLNLLLSLLCPPLSFIPAWSRSTRV